MNLLLKLLFILQSCLLFLAPLSAQDWEHIRKILSDSAAKQSFEGVILIQQAGNIRLSLPLGYADLNKSKVTGEHTVYNLASITKTITSMAIHKLFERKILNKEDPLGKFFPDSPADKQKITLHQLLSHQSGLDQSFITDGIRDNKKALSKILREKITKPNAYLYSNLNYTLLAMVIEQVSGKNFEEFVKEELLVPLQMRHTGFWDDTFADSIQVASKKLKIESKYLLRNYGWIGGAGMYSSAPDLLQLWNALLEGKLFSMELVHQMFASHTQNSNGVGIGYGFFMDKEWMEARGAEDFGHNGIVAYAPSKKIILVILSNAGKLPNGEWARNYMYKILRTNLP